MLNSLNPAIRTLSNRLARCLLFDALEFISRRLPTNVWETIEYDEMSNREKKGNKQINVCIPHNHN